MKIFYIFKRMEQNLSRNLNCGMQKDSYQRTPNAEIELDGAFLYLLHKKEHFFYVLLLIYKNHYIVARKKLSSHYFPSYLSDSPPFIFFQGSLTWMYWLPWREMFRMCFRASRILVKYFKQRVNTCINTAL